MEVNKNVKDDNEKAVIKKIAVNSDDVSCIPETYHEKLFDEYFQAAWKQKRNRLSFVQC